MLHLHAYLLQWITSCGQSDSAVASSRMHDTAVEQNLQLPLLATDAYGCTLLHMLATLCFECHVTLAAAAQQQQEVQQSSQQQQEVLLPLQATQLRSSRQPLRGLSSGFIAAATQQAHKQQLGEKRAVYQPAIRRIAAFSKPHFHGSSFAAVTAVALRNHGAAIVQRKLSGQHAVFSQTAVQLTMQALLLVYSIQQQAVTHSLPGEQAGLHKLACQLERLLALQLQRLHSCYVARSAADALANAADCGADTVSEATAAAAPGMAASPAAAAGQSSSSSAHVA
jgi:hypothetical protein